jgi:DHA2 family multidrug resistance protein
MATFSLTSTNSTELYVISGLGGSTLLATYTISFFAMGSLCILPFTTYMIGSIGVKKSILLCLSAFFVSNILSVFCVNEYQSLGLRFLQGMSAEPFFFLCTCAIRHLQPPDKVLNNSIFSLLIAIITPAFSAGIGGWLSYNYDWRYVFIVTAIMALSLFVYVHALLTEEIPVPRSSFNWPGFIFYFTACFCVLSGLTMGQFLDWDRSNLIMFLLIFGGCVFVLFVLWEMKHPRPIINFKQLKNYNYTLSAIGFCIIYFNFIGSILLLSNWLNIDVTYTPDWTGVLSFHMALPAVLIFIFRKEFIKINPKISIIIALVLFILSTFFTTTFSEEIDFKRIAIARITSGFALALIPFAIGKLLADHSEQTDVYNNIMITQVCRNLAASLGASVYLQMFWRRSVFYHDRLGSQLTAFSEQTDLFFAKAKLIGIQGKMAQAELENQLNLQSRALALDDCFYFMGWLFVALLIWISLSLIIEKYLQLKVSKTQPKII